MASDRHCMMYLTVMSTWNSLRLASLQLTLVTQLYVRRRQGGAISIRGCVAEAAAATETAESSIHRLRHDLRHQNTSRSAKTVESWRLLQTRDKQDHDIRDGRSSDALPSYERLLHNLCI